MTQYKKENILFAQKKKKKGYGRNPSGYGGQMSLFSAKGEN